MHAEHRDEGKLPAGVPYGTFLPEQAPRETRLMLCTEKSLGMNAAWEIRGSSSGEARVNQPSGNSGAGKLADGYLSGLPHLGVKTP